MPQTAIIIGAGPAGLTAAFELLQRTDIVPIVLEAEDYVGGISRTANYKGNRIDIGGHRFFSKSDRVMEWWLARMPMERAQPGQGRITYQGASRDVAAGQGPDPEKCDQVMLLRQRKSRIYFLRKFFDYPIALSLDTIRKLGLLRMTKIGFSYLRAMLFPSGKRKTWRSFSSTVSGGSCTIRSSSVTEKVWGERCSAISAEWGPSGSRGFPSSGPEAYRRQALRSGGDIGQKGTETSLIEQFLYPKHGPGQMWETVARQMRQAAGRSSRISG